MIGCILRRVSFNVSVFNFYVNKSNLKLNIEIPLNGVKPNEICISSRFSSSQPETSVNSTAEVTPLPSSISKQNNVMANETIPADGSVKDYLAKPTLRNKLKGFTSLTDYRYIYPEFLPEADPSRRHRTREILERTDMLNRRRVLDIPEFYVGSILAVTVSDQFAPGKTNRFVGICILRAERGLRYNFTLRNVVDHQGVEIMYEMYNPCILKIDVLRLEKRLDEQLLYLRDADPKYSTFPFDMEAEHHPEDKPVPINDLKVKLRPYPWFARWELWYLNGLLPFEIPKRLQKLQVKNERPWTKWDLMMDYRKKIPEEDQLPIWVEVEKHHKEMKRLRKTDRRKILLQQALEKK